MKKLISLLSISALLLSAAFGTGGMAGAITASAVDMYNVSWTPGNYACADPADFTPVGTVKIDWDPEASAKLDLSDGDVSDWAAAGYTVTPIDATNMVSWVGGAPDVADPGMPVSWSTSAYFVMDSAYLYVGFDVTDADFTYGTAARGYNGDAIQLCIDFGGKLGDVLREDPDSLCCVKNIFYSFNCTEDGAPLEIQLQESDRDGMLSEANGDGVKGAAKKTANGWSAELALSLKMLYDHYVWKAWEDDPYIYIGGMENTPLKIGLSLYYLNRAGDPKEITWAAGTVSGVVVDEAGVPGVTWTAYDNGIQLELDAREGMSFDCRSIVVLCGYSTVLETETTTPETQAPTVETEAPAVTEAPEVSDPETEAPETEAPAAETDAPAKNGCGGVIGMGAVAVLAAAAAAVALKKKD